MSLPYYDHVVRDILEVIREVDWPKPVKIKFHPTMDWKKYEKMIPQKFSITNASLQKLLCQALMVVGNSTGVMVEAASFGIPVINIKNPNSFSHDYMPEIGKGMVWDQVKSAEEVCELVTRYKKSLVENPAQLKEEGARLKSFCFAEPTDELISKAFELT